MTFDLVAFDRNDAADGGPSRNDRNEEALLAEIYLNFHGLGTAPSHIEADERPYWLTPERFEAILRLVRARDRAGRVRITFDDGNRTDVTVALPVLETFEFRAAFFLVSDRLGTPCYLGAGDVTRLRDAGMAIGSHGAAHVSWTTLHDAELTAQVARSLRVLSTLIGQPVTEVAVPFGAYDRRVLRLLRRLGVTGVYTSDTGIARPRAWLKARNTLRMDTPLEAVEALITGGFDPARRLRQSARQWAKRLHLSPASSSLFNG
jgi:peptidoglycan/xylan/chitin deacetylase (PgdA/CDA1 family)